MIRGREIREIRHHLVGIKQPNRFAERIVDQLVLMPDPADPTKLVVDARHAMGLVLPMDIKDGEKAFVQRITLLYVRSDLQQDWEISLCGLFQPSAKDGTHPDVTGTVLISVPAGVNAAPGERESLLYRPTVSALEYVDIVPFLGMESSIIGRKPGAVVAQSPNTPTIPPDFDIFAEGDPLLTFLLQYRHAFGNSIKSSDVVLMEDRSQDGRACYSVRTTASTCVSKFFEQHIAAHIRYTTAREGLRVGARPMLAPCLQNADEEEEKHSGFCGITLTLAVDYIVIGQHDPKFSTNTYQVVPQ